MNHLIDKRNSEEGSALVEFALIALVLLTLLFGIIDVGRALYAYDYVSYAARDAARFAIVRGTTCSGLSGGCPAASSDIQTYVQSNATGIDTSTLTVASHCLPPGTTAYSPPCSPGTPVQVTIQYGFEFVSPLSPQSWQMSTSSQVVTEQ